MLNYVQAASGQRRLRFATAYPSIPPEDARPWLAVRRTLQRRQRVRQSHLHVMAIVFAILIMCYAVWSLGPHIDVSLSGIVAVPEAFGFVRTGGAPRHLVGYDAPSQPAPTPTDASGDGVSLTAE